MDPCVIVYAYNILKKNKRRRRRWAVHPINRVRSVDGAFKNLYGLLREDGDKFFNYFRMSAASFDELTVKVREKNDTTLQGLNFSVEEMLAITLRYLGSGCTYTDLHYTYRVGITTASVIVPTMCTVLWETLATEVFPTFTEHYWRQEAEGFRVRANFPHCIGAVDAKHIRMVKPEHSGSLYYNYKHYFSIVLLAIADSNYKFVYVDVGACGKDADPTIFNGSTFGKAFHAKKLNIPDPEKISPNSEKLPYVLVGDEAFGIDVNLMRPFPGHHLSKTMRIFNYRLSSARRFVECTFGILTNKWRILHRPLNIHLGNSIAVVKATCALHNYVRERDGYKFQDTLEVAGLHNIEPLHDDQPLRRGNKAAYRYRNSFASYFVNEGRVAWQDDKV